MTVFFNLTCLSVPFMNKADTLLYYQNGNDSVRIVNKESKKSKYEKILYYYPDGQIESKDVSKYKKYTKEKGFGNSRTKSVEWNDEEKRVEVYGERRKWKGGSHKDLTWIRRKNGKIHWEWEWSGWKRKF